MERVQSQRAAAADDADTTALDGKLIALEVDHDGRVVGILGDELHALAVSVPALDRHFVVQPHDDDLAGARFMVADATDVSALGDECADFLVIFGILHHVESWRQAVDQCRRLLRPGGILLVEEPAGRLLRRWDRVFAWGHPRQGFSLRGLERELNTGGLELEARLKLPGVFGAYRSRKRAVAAVAASAAGAGSRH